MDCEELLNVQDAMPNLKKIQEFQSWGRKIKPLFQLLARVPSTDLEIRICSDENQLMDKDPLLTDLELLAKCQGLHEELVDIINQKKTEVKKIWETVQEKWKELEKNEEFQLTFTYAEAGVIKAVEDLHSQLILRDQDKKLRIALFIGELRKEISAIWDQCMIADEEQKSFKEFYIEITEFSEELLSIHKEELKKWQIYHEKNQEILVKIKKRENMWSKLKELEARAADPNRFINRGGALLKDQNMHNHIMKTLPKLEADLAKLAEVFEKEHGRKMKILGEEICCMIDEEWKAFKEEKATRKNARVHQTVNPSINTPSLTPGIALRPRKSMMPIQGSRPLQKRPATKLAAFDTPLAKRGKCESKESVKSEDDNRN